MTEDSEKYRHKLRADSPRQIIGIIFCVLFANIAKDAGWLPYIPAFVLAFTVAYLADYWFPPRPPMGFPIWFVRVVLLMGLMLLGTWLVPRLLSKWIWTPLAYAIPVFLLFLFSHWLSPLYPIKREKSFKKTLIASLVFAVIFALIGSFTSAGK
jgi:hypothetical protein